MRNGDYFEVWEAMPHRPFRIDLSGIPRKSMAYVSRQDGCVIEHAETLSDLLCRIAGRNDGFIIDVWAETRPIMGVSDYFRPRPSLLAEET